VEAFGLSDRGCVRPNNEDYYLIDPELGLYLIADGMGGAQAGEHASKLAAETVREVVRRNGSPSSDTLCRAFEEANRRVLSAASSDVSLEGMGTTLVAALESGDELLIASVGDSRAYVHQDRRLIAITEDQTWVQEVGRKLGIGEADLKKHPMRHVLTMAIGVGPKLRVHLYAVQPRPGMEVLLCSDGLHGVLSEDRILEVLQQGHDLESKCRKLIEQTRSAGGPDNVTAVLLRPSA
jgi:serine/threonine protein phosphatase PrpC